jgi:hypothetical protein
MEARHLLNSLCGVYNAVAKRELLPYVNRKESAFQANCDRVNMPICKMLDMVAELVIRVSDLTPYELATLNAIRRNLYLANILKPPIAPPEPVKRGHKAIAQWMLQ